MATLFAVCTPGLEPYLSQELHEVGCRLTRNSSQYGFWSSEDSGGVEFDGEIRDIYNTNLHLRTANRILLRLGTFRTTAFADLRKKASQLSWGTYLNKHQPVSIRVTCHKSKLYHSDAVAERVAGAISDHLGKEVAVEKFDDQTENPPQLILVRLSNDQCTISLDTSGALLHRRGYRQALAKAPLRETLAAGLVLASGWDRSSPLLDPFCGSGTIPIEAALLAAHIAPGKNRRFAFMNWKNYDSRLWGELKQEAVKNENMASIPLIFGSDRDAGACEMAQSNLERAGVTGAVQISCRVISSIEPPPVPGWIVTNPPYGVRVNSSRDLRNLYAQIGNVLRATCPGWRVGILCSDDQLINQVKMPISQRVNLINGGLSVKFSCGQISKPR